MNLQFLALLEGNSGQLLDDPNISIDHLIWISDPKDIEIPDQRLWKTYIRKPSKEKVRYILDINFHPTESIVSLFIKYHKYLSKLTYIENSWELLFSLSQEIDADLSCDYIDFPSSCDYFNNRIIQMLFDWSCGSQIAKRHMKDVTLVKKKYFWNITFQSLLP